MDGAVTFFFSANTNGLYMIYSYAEGGGGIREVEGNRKDMSSWVNKVSLYLPSSMFVREYNISVFLRSTLFALASVYTQLWGWRRWCCIYTFLYLFPHYMEHAARL